MPKASSERGARAHSPVRRWARRPDLIGASVALVGLIVVLAVNLGPALVGQKTFSAMDRLSSVAPWWNGGPRPSVLNPFLGDSIDSLLPTYLQMHERLFSGEWPLWSSLGGAGTELLATTNSPALTLSTMWFLVLPTVYAPGFVKLVEIALAMGGMYLWMRRIGLGRAAGVLAGVFYCGSGFFVGWATWSAQSSVAAMMPALFWAVERYLALRTARAAIPIAAVVALLLLGGFPAAAGHALYAGAIYFVVRLLAERSGRRWGSELAVFAGGVGAVVVGVALSAVQLIPLAFGLADVDLSVRSGQFYAQQPFRSFLSMFFPESIFSIGFGAGTNPIEGYAFLGIGAVFFAAVAVFTPRMRGQARGVVPFLAVGALLAAAVVWYQGWWTAWLADLPVFSGNNSGRLRDIVLLFGSALAAIGAQRVFQASSAVRTRVLVIAGAALAGFGALTVVVWAKFPQLLGVTLVKDALPGLLIVCLAALAVVWARRKAVRVAAFAGVAVLAAVQMSGSVANYWPLSDREDFYPRLSLITELDDVAGSARILTSGSFMGSTATAYGLRSATSHSFQPTSWREYLVALELGAFGAGQSPTNPTLTFPGEEAPQQTALLDRLAAAAWTTPAGAEVPGPELALDGAAWAEPVAEGTAAVAANEAIRLPLTAGGVRAATIHVAEQVQGGEGGLRFDVRILGADGVPVAEGALVRSLVNPGPVLIPVAGEGIAGEEDVTLEIAVNADVVLDTDASGTPLVSVTGTADDGLRLDYADANGTVWVRETAMPRIRWASASEVVADPEERLAVLGEPALDRSTVVLSEPGPAAEGADAAIDVEEDGGDDIRVRVDAAAGGYLVVGDWMHRGWTVTVDGSAAELVEADHALSAVFVPAGVHDVAFRYTGVGVFTGALVSLGAVLVIAGVLGFSWWRRRSDSDARPAGTPAAS